VNTHMHVAYSVQCNLLDFNVFNLLLGIEDEERLLRRTICRYTCLSITQCFTLISTQTKKRFPTTDHFIAAGLLMENEKHAMEDVIAGMGSINT